MNLIYFRQDLRISDNLALFEAAKNAENLTAIFILDEETKAVRKLGGASKYFLHHALKSLEKSLVQYGIPLVYKVGEVEKILPQFIKEHKINKVFCNILHEPYWRKIDKNLAKTFNIEFFNSSFLVDAKTHLNQTGGYYKVFTAFYKAHNRTEARNFNVQKLLQEKNFKVSTKSISLEGLNLLPTKPNWAKNFDNLWKISEDDAQKMLYSFLDNKVKNYSLGRDFPAIEAVSKLSPYLQWGLISPYQIISVCDYYSEKYSNLSAQINKFISEIYWREFSHYLLYHFPELNTHNFRPEFDNFPWEENSENLKKWQKGLTGYPIIDAGMRELWQTGFMHNRVRMIVASFLTKHLRIHWKHGENWFWDTLLDASLANNSASWQWVAGSGADAAPYFRIFNPILQGEKFDANGEYVKKYLPELKNLPKEFIHKPWEASPLELKSFGVELGKNYPQPIVNHEKARNLALDAYKKIKAN